VDSTDNADHQSEAEIQALIAHLEIEQPIETANNIGYSFYPQDLEQAARSFRRSLVDWVEDSLCAGGQPVPLRGAGRHSRRHQQ
jgi:hypothetical protein